MSYMEQWAKREIEIACKRERGDKNPNEWDYGVAKKLIRSGNLNTIRLE
jgi:hypothetical protein